MELSKTEKEILIESLDLEILELQEKIDGGVVGLREYRQNKLKTAKELLKKLIKYNP